MQMPSSRTFAAALVATLAAAGLPVPALALEVGTAAAVNADTFGTPPGADTRLISLGTEVLFEERLETGSGGSAQILFLDQSTITIGPDSELLIDRYVYDPDTGTGETVLSFTKGVMRFVGGQISKGEGAVTIQTPTATVGIRGGIGIVSQGDQGTRAIFVAGDEMSISSGGDPGIKITRPGGSATVDGDGGINDTGPASSEEISQANGQTQGNGGGGLEGDGPTDETADQSLGNGLAGNQQTLTQPPVSVGTTQTTTQETTDGTQTVFDPVSSDALDSNQQIANQQAVNQRQQQQQTSGPSSTPSGGSQSSSGGQNSETGGGSGGVSGGSSGGSSGGGSSDPPRSTFGGRLLATQEDGYTDSFGAVFTDPVAQFALGGPDTRFDLAVTSAYVEDGRWVGSTSSGAINLPLGSGSFTVNAANASTPFGPASGSGFYDSGDNFAFYALTTTRNDFAQRIAIWGGTPTPSGGNDSGTGSVSFQTYTLDADPYRGGNIPLVPSDAGSLFTSPGVTPVYVLQNASGKLVREVGFTTDGGPQSKVVQMTVAIEGQGSAQKSLIYGTVGEPQLTSQGKVLISQGGTGMIRTAGGHRSNRVYASLNSQEGATGDHFYGPDRDYFVAGHNGIFVGDDDLGREYDSIGYNRFDSSVQADPEGYLHLARQTQNPSGLGTSRTSRDLNGYAAGIGETKQPNVTPFPFFGEPYLLSNQNHDPTAVRLVFNPTTNSAGMAMTLTESDIVASDVNQMVLGFGGTNAFRGAFLDDDTYALRDSDSAGAAQLGITPGVDGSPGAASTFHPDGFRSIALSGEAVAVSGVLPAGVTFCDCQYMEWGWWATEFRWDSTEGANADRREHVHLGSFVAGELPDLGDIPNDDTATFAGHAAGNVYNNGNQYIAVGNFAGSWDFDTDSGLIDITKFDGKDYEDIAISAVNRRDFTGNDADVTTPVGVGRIDVNGSLFRAGSDPAGAMGGNFQILKTEGIAGDLYRAIGTFVGEQSGS